VTCIDFRKVVFPAIRDRSRHWNPDSYDCGRVTGNPEYWLANRSGPATASRPVQTRPATFGIQPALGLSAMYSVFRPLASRPLVSDSSFHLYCAGSSVVYHRFLTGVHDGNAGPSTPLKNASLRMTAFGGLRMTASGGLRMTAVWGTQDDRPGGVFESDV
jgi:hypothetical protein